MTTKHTSGPWKRELWEYSKANPPRKELCIQNGKHRIAVLDCDIIGDNPFTITMEEAESNARLIAAAPDMLEALKKQDNTFKSIRAALWNWAEKLEAKRKNGQALTEMETMIEHNARETCYEIRDALACGIISKAEGNG